MSKEFRLPDVKGKRFRQETYNICNKEFYERFREKFPKYKDLPDSLLRDIIKKFNETLWETVIDTRDGVQIPQSLGCLFVATCQAPEFGNIDYGKSIKYGIAVRNKNWETDGKLAKIVYTSFLNKYKFMFRECWGFLACRNFKRKVSKVYPENWTMYIQVASNTKIKKEFEKHAMKSRIQTNLDYKLRNYNEFDL